MSYSEQFFFDDKGIAHGGEEYRNGHGYSMPVWTYIAEKYIPRLPGETDQQFSIRWWQIDKCEGVWKMGKDPRLERWERICLLASFDNIVAKRENFAELADAFEKFETEFKKTNPNFVCHYGAMAKEIRGLDQKYQAVGWYATSVGDNPWWTHDECECPKCGDSHQTEGRPYDLNKDDKHFFLFEDEVMVANR